MDRKEETEKRLTLQDREAWRSWLMDFHGEEECAWLVIRKKGSGGQGVLYDEALEEALCYGWIDGKMRSLDSEKYILRFTPRRNRSVWSKRNRELAVQLIDAGRMTKAGLQKIEEAKENGRWEAAYSVRDSIDPPADLVRALKPGSAAWSNFDAFANTYKNAYVRWIEDAKTEDTRRKRIEEVVNRSENNTKPGIE